MAVWRKSVIDLKGHAALVTGSSKGVGRAIAIAFAQAGADVVIHGREKGAEADEVIATCGKAGVKVDFNARLSARRDHFIRLRAFLAAMNHHVRAGLRERDRDRAADAFA